MRSPPPLPAPPPAPSPLIPEEPGCGASRGWEPLLAPSGAPLPTAPECHGPRTAVEARDGNHGARVFPGFGAGPWREESSRETDTHLPSPSPVCPPGCWRPMDTHRQRRPSRVPVLRCLDASPPRAGFPSLWALPTSPPLILGAQPGRGARASISGSQERADGHGLLGSPEPWGPGGG